MDTGLLKAAAVRFGRIVLFAILAQLATLQIDITQPKVALIVVGNAVVTGIIAGIDKYIRGTK